MAKATAARNLKLLNWITVLSSLRLYEGVLAVYLGMITDSFAIGMTFFALINIASSVFELPTGIFSDRLGRRTTIILQKLTAMVGISFIYFATSAWEIYVAGIVYGLTMALRSGTITAFTYESLETLDRVGDYKKVDGLRRALRRYALLLAGIVGSGVIYLYDIKTAIAISAVFTFASLLLSFWLRDVRQVISTEQTLRKDIALAWGNFLRDPALRDLGIARALATGLGNAEYRFRSLFYAALVPLWAVSLISSLSQLFTGLAMQFSHQVVERIGFMRSLVHLDLFDRLTTTVLVASQSVIGPWAMSFVTSISFGVRSIAAEELLQERFEKVQRATMGSIVGLGGNVVYGAFAIMLGYMADLWGVLTVMLVAQPFLLTYVFFFYRGVKLSRP